MGAVPMRARCEQGFQRDNPTMILDLLDTGTARREWRRGSAQAMGLSKRGRRNGAETEGHTEAWAQWSRAAQCRRYDEGQGSAEIAGRRGRRSGRGKRMDTVQERGTRAACGGRNADGARGSVGAMRVVAEPGRGWRGAATRAELFAQTRKHCRNALLQRFDEPLVHFEHLLQIGRRGAFHVITRADGAGHGELRRQSGSDIVGGNFVPVAGNGKQANRCRAPWLWARNGLSRSAHVGESGRASIHHDAARGYRDHSFEGERPFARANRICTKCHSNPLSTWPKHHLIVRSGADAP